MKRAHILFSILLGALLYASCTPPNPEQQKSTPHINDLLPTADPAATTAATVPIADDTDSDTTEHFVDSFKIKMNTLMASRIELPPVYQHEIFSQDTIATIKLSKLSKACNGRMKIITNSSTVVNELEETIKATSIDGADLVILLDRTGSMTDEIEFVKLGINQIIDTIKKHRGVRLAIATYGDKNWDKAPWFTFKSFETNYQAAAEYVNSVKVIGNLDWPESVYDAVVKCMQNDFWRSAKKRNLILVGDAPPQEKPMSDYSLDDVIKISKDMKVAMNFYPILVMPEIQQVRVSDEDKNKYKEVRQNTTLYPNPSRGILNLGMEATATYYLELYNSNGQIVHNEEFFGVHWTKDISNLPNGMYIMRVINTDHTFELIKFVLQH